MKENTSIFKVLFIIFLIISIGLGVFIVYDKFVVQNNGKENEQENNINNYSTENTKNDLSKLEAILKQKAFGNFDQSVEKYFEGYLGPIVEIMAKKELIESGHSIKNLSYNDLSKEDIARIICLKTSYANNTITIYDVNQEKIIFSKSDINSIMKNYFNISNYEDSKLKDFNNWQEQYGKGKIYKDNDKLICENTYATKVNEVTNVTYDETTQKIMVYIDVINPGQAGAPNIDYTGYIELKYNDDNFNVVNVNFKNVLD